MCDSIANGPPRCCDSNGSTIVISPLANIAGANGNVFIAGNILASNIYGTISTPYQPLITTVGILSNLVVAGRITAASLNVITANFISNIYTTNIFGTVMTPAQPFITSVGTLTTLNVSGTSNVTSLYAAQVYGDGSGLSGLNGSNVTGVVPLAHQVVDSAQPNITSVGTLSSVNVSGVSNLTALTGSLMTAAQPNITSTGILTSLNVSGNSNVQNLWATNIYGTVSTSSQPLITSLGNLTSLTTNGLLTTANITGSNGNVSVTGNLFASNLYVANIAGVQFSQWVSNPDGNIYFMNSIGIGTNTPLANLEVVGNALITDSLTANYLYGTLKTGNQNLITNVGTLSNLVVAGNVVAGNISGNGWALANIYGSNILGPVNLSYSVINAAQPNITSVGILTGLTVHGDLSAYTLAGDGSALSNIQLANTVGILDVARSVTENAQPNITSVGTLTDLTINGVLQVPTIVSANGSAIGNLNAANLFGSVSLAEAVTGNAQPNITSLGNLTSLVVTGQTRSGTFVGTGSGLSGIRASNIVGVVPVAISVTGSSQSNITSVGTLDYLNVYTGITANLYTGNASGLSNIQASNVVGVISSNVLPPSGVTPGTYGSFANVSQVTVDSYGRVTAAQNTAITSSQWTNVGSDIYLLANVAVGTSNTNLGKLTVDGNLNVISSFVAQPGLVTFADKIISGGSNVTNSNVAGFINIATGNATYFGVLNENVAVSNITTLLSSQANISNISGLSANVTTTNTWLSNTQTGNVSVFSALNANIARLSTPSANITTLNAFQMFETISNIYLLNAAVVTMTSANIWNVTALSSNITTANTWTSNTAYGNVVNFTSYQSNILGLNVYTSNTSISNVSNLTTIYSNISALNVISSNTLSANVSGFESLASNIVVLNVISSNTDAANVTTLGVLTANLATLNVFTSNTDTSNVTTLEVLTANINSTNLITANVSILTSLDSNISTLNVSASNTATANVTTLGVLTANINSANLITSNLVTANVSTLTSLNANVSTLNVFTSNTATANVTSIGVLTANVSTLNAFTSNAATANVTSLGVLTANINSANLVTSNLVTANVSTLTSLNANVSTLNVSTSNTATANVTSLGVLTANINSANLITSNLVTANVSTLTSLNANVSTLNVFTSNTATANVTSLGVLTANINSANLVTSNLVSANVSTLTSLNANVSTLNVSTSNTATGNVSTLGVLTANINSGNITTANIYNANVTNTVFTTNVVAAGFTSNAANTVFNFDTFTIPYIYSTTINVSSVANLLNSNLATANVSTLGVLAANVSTLNVSTSNTATANVTTLGVLTANINSANLVTSNLVTANVSTLTSLNSNITTANVTTSNTATGNVTSLGVLTINAASANVTTLNVTGQSNLIGGIIGTLITSAQPNIGSITNLLVNNSLTSTNIWANSISVTAATNSNVAFFSNLGGLSNIFVMNQYANVGIGTTNPLARLHVTGPANVGNMLVRPFDFTVATGAGSYTNVCSIVDSPNGSGIYAIRADMMTRGAGGTAMTRTYIITCNYNATSGTWTRVVPISRPSGNNQIGLDALTTGGTTTLRATNLNANEIVSVGIVIQVSSSSFSTVQVTDKTTETGTGATSTGYYPTTVLTEVAGLVGIYTETPGANLQVTGNIYVSNAIQGNVISAQINATNMNVTTSNIVTSNLGSSNIATLTSLSSNIAVLSATTTNLVSANILTLTSLNSNITTLNVTTSNTATGNVTTLGVLTANINSANLVTSNLVTANVSTLTSLNANVSTLNVSSSNTATGNVTSLGVLNLNAATVNLFNSNLSTANISTLGVINANIAILNVTTSNTATANVTSLGVLNLNGSSVNILNSNLLTSNITSLGVLTGNVASLNVGAAYFGTANVVAGLGANTAFFNLAKVGTMNAANINSQNLAVSNALIANLIAYQANSLLINVTQEFSALSNITTLNTASLSVTGAIVPGAATGNTYLTGNIVVSGNVFSALGDPLGSGGGYYLSLPSDIAIQTPYTGALYGTTYPLSVGLSNGFTISGTSTLITVTTHGNFKFSRAGAYKISAVFLSSDNVTGVALGSNVADIHGQDQGYMYRYTTFLSQNPTELIEIPLNITDTSLYYYLDIFKVDAGVLHQTSDSRGGTYLTITPLQGGGLASGGPGGTPGTQWVSSGTNIYYANSVGIGAVNPAYNLDVSTGTAAAQRLVTSNIESLGLYGPSLNIASNVLIQSNLAINGLSGLASLTPPYALTVYGQGYFSEHVTFENFAGYRNRLINGTFRVAQRANTITVANTSTFSLSNAFVMDRWRVDVGNLSTSNVAMTIRQDVPVGQTNGFSNVANVYVSRSFGSTTDNTWVCPFVQTVEASGTYDLRLGYSTAKPMVLSFYANVSVTGNYSVVVRSKQDNTYYANLVTLTNSWNRYTLYIPPCTIGTWGTGINGSLEVCLFGVSFGTGRANVAVSTNWTASPGYAPMAVTGAVNWMSTAPSQIQVTGVQLELGKIATPFEIRLLSETVRLCQRYFETNPDTQYAAALGSGRINSIPYVVTKRAHGNVSVYRDLSNLTVNTNVNQFIAYYGDGTLKGTQAINSYLNSDYGFSFNFTNTGSKFMDSSIMEAQFVWVSDAEIY